MKIRRVWSRIRALSPRAALGRAHAAIGKPDLRDVAILAGMALLWLGLRDAYGPAGNIGVGAFLLWFTTIRKSA